VGIISLWNLTLSTSKGFATAMENPPERRPIAT